MVDGVSTLWLVAVRVGFEKDRGAERYLAFSAGGQTTTPYGISGLTNTCTYRSPSYIISSVHSVSTNTGN